MAIHFGPQHSFRLNEPIPSTPEKAAAYATAMQIKKEVEQARAETQEVFVNTTEDLRSLAYQPHVPYKETLSSTSTDTEGNLTTFVQSDHHKGQQLRLSREVAGSLVGGMMGGILQSKNFDTFTRISILPDGVNFTQAVTIDKTSGLMKYTEFEMR